MTEDDNVRDHDWIMMRDAAARLQRTDMRVWRVRIFLERDGTWNPDLASEMLEELEEAYQDLNLAYQGIKELRDRAQKRSARGSDELGGAA